MAKDKTTKTDPVVTSPIAAEKPAKTKKPKAEPKPKPVYKFEKSEHDGRMVFTAKGKGKVTGEDVGQSRIRVNIDGTDHDFSTPSIRFKAVDDKYRENYEIDRSVKTESGAPTISNGDDLAEAVKGLPLTTMQEVANENGVEFEGWSHLNKGMQSMNIRNALRKLWKADAKSVKIQGKSVAEAQKARMEEAKAARKAMDEKKAERDKANKEKADARAKAAAEKKAKADAKTAEGAKPAGKKGAEKAPAKAA